MELNSSQTNWAELLDTLKDILLQDETKLENNISFYKKLLENPQADKRKLENMYQKVTWDQNRLLLLQEIMKRLCMFDILNIAENLQTAIQTEATKKGGRIENWSFTIQKENEELRTFFFPLSNDRNPETQPTE